MDKIVIKEIYLPVIYIIVGYIAYRCFKWIMNRTLNKKQQNLEKKSYNYKKIETFKTLIDNFIKIIIIIFTVLSILPIYGINVSSLLAGLGIFSAVVALAFQDTLKDLIGGVSIILENQFAIGDTISVDGFKGEVIQMGLKTTRIRSYSGEVKIIANRNITDIINYSCSYSLAIVDVSVSYEDDLEKAEQVLTKLAEKLTKTLPKLKGPVEVLGVEDLESSAVIFRITAKTQALEQFNIERLLRKEIKLCLDQKNIKIPYQQIEVHNGKKRI